MTERRVRLRGRDGTMGWKFDVRKDTELISWRIWEKMHWSLLLPGLWTWTVDLYFGIVGRRATWSRRTNCIANGMMLHSTYTNFALKEHMLGKMRRGNIEGIRGIRWTNVKALENGYWYLSEASERLYTFLFWSCN